MPWDRIGFSLIQSLTGNPILDDAMMFSAEILVLIVPLCLVYLWFQRREAKVDSLFTFSIAITGLAISYVIAIFFSHQNPSVFYETLARAKPENAFPSQHTAVILSTAIGFLWRERRELGYIVLIAGFLTGFARVYIGEHWPVDILGSLISALLGFAVIYLFEDYIRPILGYLASIGIRMEDLLLEKLNRIT